MIVVSLHCQMGNQMFQYAFARALSKRLKTGYIPFVSSPYYPYRLSYFKTDWLTNFIYTSDWRTKQFKRICRKLIKYRCSAKIEDDECNPIDYDTDGVYYHGFFQSEIYFKEFELEIKKIFQIRKKYHSEFLEKYDEYLKTNKVIVVHVRRTDYLEVEFEGLGGQGVALPFEYYHKALNDIPNIEDYKVLFIGDDVDSIKVEFGEKSNYRFETNTAIIDFQLIQHADIAIIANSTFAWWAAYLSQKSDAKIIAPEYWLGYKVKKEYPVGIHTDKFEWLEF